MAEMYGGDYLYDILSNDAGLSALTTSIFNARMVPQTVTADKTINFYQTGTVNGGDSFFDLDYSIDCRAKHDYEAFEIATAVKEALNRNFKNVNGKRYFSVITINPVIPPLDDADVYNVPVTARIRRK